MKRIPVFVMIQVALFMLTNTLNAQIKESEILFTPDRPEITTAGNEVIDILLKIQNQSLHLFKGSINISVSDNELALASKPIISVNLPAHDNMYIPLKVFIPARALAGRRYTVNMSLKYDDGSVMKTVSCAIKVTVKRNVILYVSSGTVQIESNTDSLRIPVRVINSGNTLEDLTIVNGQSVSAGGGGFHNSIRFKLQPYKDSVLYIKKKVVKAMLKAGSFEISVRGFYTNGELFGMSSVRVQNTRSVRVFTAEDEEEQVEDNYFSFSSDNILNPYRSYLLSSFTSAALPAGKISCNLDASVFNNVTRQVLLRNTWLSYETSSFGGRLGNISRNGELSLSGRGGLFFIRDSLSNNILETGYIDKTYNLIGNLRNGSSSQGNAGWASFYHRNKNFNIKSTIIYDKSTYTGAANSILSNDLNWTNSKNIRVSASLSGGYMKSSDSLNDNRLGLAAGLSMDMRLGKLSLNGNNFFSQKTYPGLRKGTTSISEQINLTMASVNTWCNLNIYHYSPGGVKAGTQSPLYDSKRCELGISSTFRKKFTVSLSPGYFSEQNNLYLINNDNTGALFKSWNFHAASICILSAHQSFSLNTESGFYSSSFSNKQLFHFKSTSNYRYKSFSVYSSYQKGSFFLGELQNCFARNKLHSSEISISPAFEKDLFKQRGTINTSVSYLKSNVTGTNFSLNSRFECDIIRNTRFFCGLTFNKIKYDVAQYQSNNLQIGITQKFSTPKVTPAGHNMIIFLYKDINQNGLYDKSDSVAANQPLLINEVMFLSSKEGNILYKHVPSGSYFISVPYLKGWYAVSQQISLTKSSRIEIPLQRTGILTGTISFSSTNFSYEIPQTKGGIMITVKDSEGRIRNTKTNEDGQFTFYLPSGKYNISIQDINLPGDTECLTNHQDIYISPQNKTSASFILRIKDRKIETRKFVSPNLRN